MTQSCFTHERAHSARACPGPALPVIVILSPEFLYHCRSSPQLGDGRSKPHRPADLPQRTKPSYIENIEINSNTKGFLVDFESVCVQTLAFLSLI